MTFFKTPLLQSEMQQHARETVVEEPFPTDVVVEAKNSEMGKKSRRKILRELRKKGSQFLISLIG